jgi:alpha-D-ribose 1-methylphosphonate 5-triphosphate synthase subunit PhnH
MSTLAPYNDIFDAQRHYRTLLDCTARPGTIGQLDDVQLDVPPQYSRATALIALTLFGSDTTYCLIQNPAQAAAQPAETDCSILRGWTAARPASVAEAEFLILFDPAQLEALEDVRVGTLPYPETSATVIAQVEAISPAPMPGALRLRLTGPGIETENDVFVAGVSESFFATRRELNAEFPVGIDVFLTCDSLSAGPCVLGLPRTTLVDWQRI